MGEQTQPDLFSAKSSILITLPLMLQVHCNCVLNKQLIFPFLRMTTGNTVVIAIDEFHHQISLILIDILRDIWFFMWVQQIPSLFLTLILKVAFLHKTLSTYNFVEHTIFIMFLLLLPYSLDKLDLCTFTMVVSHKIFKHCIDKSYSMK